MFVLEPLEIVLISVSISLWIINFYVADEIRKEYNIRNKDDKKEIATSRYFSVFWVFIIPVVLFLAIKFSDPALIAYMIIIYTLLYILTTDNIIMKKLIAIVDI
ncbi:hypothetical protein JO84_gp320 [Aureococcus anophagefferens virus]|uniref:Uncharacterized protein n=1 Tax=Aureococcus anophagefferens virus TaxID=1474867 RepID=A0A076FGV7_9VIRU|nr:hypothetical protein JO84_gp320 [Aureococcus anophagefferens virus]AII16967.1 hypothetical protein AaV_154 [Aureococcus anophagefferens virus]UOG94068.1 hypothetical protein MKD35_27 [Aureococcus anophagefferens virus]